MIYYVIPCRKNSKGIKHKNRFLWEHTVSTIPEELHSKTIVTTDDMFIIGKAKKLFMKTIIRSKKISADDTLIKDVMVDVVESLSLNKDDHIVMLYLTYPYREWDDVEKALLFYESKKCKSLLCARDLATHPFLCFYKLAGNKGMPIVDHNLYRRQDYPECFALSHFVCIFSVGEVYNLNGNLYNIDTDFYPIHKNPLDVDIEEDLKSLKR